MPERSVHPDVVDLAEYAEGLLDAARQADIDHHVRGCPDCAATLSDLAGLPQTLAAAPVPPLPPDVAERLDRAIAAEAQARASSWSGTAQVTPLRPRRRWLAPAVAAAVVMGAVAVAVPIVLNDDPGSDDAAGEMQSGAEAEPAPEENAAEREGGSADGAAPPAELSSDSFGRDVIDNFYAGSRDLRVARLEALTSSGPSISPGELGKLPDACDRPVLPDGTVDDISYDGESALLLRRESGKAVDVVAYRCDGEKPTVLDAVTLRPRR